MKLKKIRSGLWLELDLIKSLVKNSDSGRWVLNYAGSDLMLTVADGQLVEDYLDAIINKKK